MDTEVLILANDGTGWRKKGYVIYEKPSPAPWGSKEGLPDFIRLKVKGADPEKHVRKFREPWNSKHDWRVLNHNADDDSFEVAISATQVNKSGEGRVRTECVKRVFEFHPVNFVEGKSKANVKVVNYKIYDLIISPRFLGLPNILGVKFSEVSYDPNTGDHTIEMDYKKKQLITNEVGKTEREIDPKRLEKMLVGMKSEILSHKKRVIRFKINREEVIKYLKRTYDEETHGDQRIEVRQFYVDRDYVDEVIAKGGIDEITRAEFEALIKNRLDE